MLPDPPDDPEAWSDEQWIEWLAAVEAANPEDATSHRPRWRQQRSSQVLYASMLAVHTAIYGQVEEPTIVIQAAGDPPAPEPVEVKLEPDHPEQSTVTVRPWLMHEGEQGE